MTEVKLVPGLSPISAAGIGVSIFGVFKGLDHPSTGLAVAGAAVAIVNYAMHAWHKQQLLEIYADDDDEGDVEPLHFIHAAAGPDQA